jgi:hypothetical protein
MSESFDAEAAGHESEALYHACRDVLAGHPAHVQGATLADLLATWLAGHRIIDNPRETKRVRERLIEEHLKVVRKLIPLNDKMIDHKLRVN